MSEISPVLETRRSCFVDVVDSGNWYGVDLLYGIGFARYSESPMMIGLVRRQLDVDLHRALVRDDDLDVL